tara:strand:- start:345 stop:1454 length:1110 start_codon:yes stop_codon:yes gene_type:complete
MRFISLITFFLISTTAVSQNAVQKFFKYSTVYTSAFANSPMQPTTEYYVTQGGDLRDITVENPFDYTATIGIRKVARFKYENRQNRFYDGQTEATTSLSATVGAVKGWEYLAQYDMGRQQGRDYINQRYFLRYLGERWMVKGEYYQQGLVGLNYTQVDSRLRMHVGELDLSIGAAARQHQPYGYNPIADYLQTNPWWELAFEYGYEDYYYGIDYDNDDVLDNFDWFWEDINGVRVADTDEDFRKYIYGDIVNDYNKARLSEVGALGSLSAIAGLDYYHYEEDFWFHTWASILPWHMHILGNPMYSYEQFADQLENTNHFIDGQWIDYNAGAVVGWKIGANWGLFAEGEYMKYWDREIFNVRLGLNYQFR